MEETAFSRRRLLAGGMVAAGAAALAERSTAAAKPAASPAGTPSGAIVRTVLGDIAPENMGITLMHEHLSLDLGPNASLDASYTRDVGLMVDEVTLAGLVGVSGMVDCSMDDLKVSLADLRTMSQRSGVHIVVAVGHYVEKFFPPEIATQSEDQIADAMVKRAAEMPAGLIAEIGSSGTKEQGWITPMERKMFRAAAKAQQMTGLKILTHTPEGKGALNQLDLLESAGAKPENVAIGHVDCIVDLPMHAELAKRGAWVAFDRVGIEATMIPGVPLPSDADRARMVTNLVDKGYANRILLSADTARPMRLIKFGGKGYGETISHFVPRLYQAGVPPLVLNQIVRTNPQRFLAFTPKT